MPDVGLLDLADHLCPGGICQEALEGATIRPDGVHYDIAGARGVASWVLEEIRSGRPAPPTAGVRGLREEAWPSQNRSGRQ